MEDFNCKNDNDSGDRISIPNSQNGRCKSKEKDKISVVNVKKQSVTMVTDL